LLLYQKVGIVQHAAGGLAHGLSRRAEEDYRPARRHTARRRQQRERERDWSTRALRETEYSVDLHNRHVHCVFTSVMQKVYSIPSGVGQNSVKTMVVVLGLMTLNFSQDGAPAQSPSALSSVAMQSSFSCSHTSL